MRAWEGHSRSIWSDAFSADGSRIVTGSDDVNLCVCDAMKGELTRKLIGHIDSVCSVAISLAKMDVASCLCLLTRQCVCGM